MSTEIKRQLPDEELLSFGYKPQTTITRVYHPDDVSTKSLIVDYYSKIIGFILPYLVKRPQYVNRDLTFDETFFLKEGSFDIPVWLDKIKEAKKIKGMTLLLCNTHESFQYLVNRGLIEVNTWHSSIASLDYPDYLVLDLDPSEQNTFAQVKRVAKVIKSILDKAGAESFCKTTGAYGLHILIPIGVRYPYKIVHDFAYTICMLANKRIPELTSLDKAKSIKDHKIFLDFQQNKRGKSIASVYSVRDYPGAPVSTPIAWEEIKDDLNPYDFNISTVPDRLNKLGDLYTGLLGNGINIQNCLNALGAL
jgi:bifunctional non-homologous end joining protein LigD